MKHALALLKRQHDAQLYLWLMWSSVETEDFDMAMQAQLLYLSYTDEAFELSEGMTAREWQAYWTLRRIANGN